MSGSGFENRLAKNARHFLKWAKRRGLEAFRVYDLDMPDVPVAVDLYAGRIAPAGRRSGLLQLSARDRARRVEESRRGSC